MIYPKETILAIDVVVKNPEGAHYYRQKIDIRGCMSYTWVTDGISSTASLILTNFEAA